jgi:hypothetical protein
LDGGKKEMKARCASSGAEVPKIATKVVNVNAKD